ncbi:MAG: NPCBM/NEW2 domain-containing protein, partial [Planctomycetota bacterium]
MSICRCLVVVLWFMICGSIALGQVSYPGGEEGRTQAPQGSSKSAVLPKAPGKVGDDPTWYQREESWEATMLASLERIFIEHQRKVGGKQGRAFEPLTSEVMRGGDPAQRVSVSVEGLEELCLIVTGVPDEIWGAATWADAKLIARDGTEERLCEMKPLGVLAGRYSIDENMYSGVSGPLKIRGEHFEHGVHVYAHSSIRIPLKNKHVRFESAIGVDDWVGANGAVRFKVTDSTGSARFKLWQLLCRDFTDGVSRRQMLSAREDRLFDFDVWPEDIRAALGKRFAMGAFRVRALAEGAETGRWQAREAYYHSREIGDAWRRGRELNTAGLRLAINDIATSSVPGEYPGAAGYLERLTAIDTELAELNARRGGSPLATDSIRVPRRIKQLVADYDRLQSEALLANPLMGFGELMLIRRTPEGDPRRAVGTGKGV